MKVKTHKRVLRIAAVCWLMLVITATAGPSVTYELKWQVTSSGGNVAGGPYRVSQAIGQTAAGYSSVAPTRVNCGFEQSFTTGCCVGTTGNVDCSVGDGVDIGDLTALIDNLFISFTPLCCEGEANCDGSGGVDIGDLTALIDNLFVTFTPLATCP